MPVDAATLRVGTCGFCMRYADYFREFSLTELQQPFYQPPQLKTAARWREQAGDAFEFVLKAFQAITHHPGSPTYRKCRLLSADEKRQAGFFRDTDVVRAAWKVTKDLADVLRATWVIFQCPAKFEPTGTNLANLRQFFAWADRGDLRFGWEPRGPLWHAEVVTELCRELDLVHVVDPFYDDCAWGRPRYYRLHGLIDEAGRYDYDYRYTDEELRQIFAWCDAGDYVLFNNIPMCDDAGRFRTTRPRG